MNRKQNIIVGVACGAILLSSGVSFFVGRATHKTVINNSSVKATGTNNSATKEDITWTCSMHPQIKLKDKVPCPICGMELIPLKKGGEQLGERELRLSPYAEKLAAVTVSPVEKRRVSMTVNMLGKVSFDETRLKQVSARFGGRLDRLFVDYTGVQVKKGDHLFEVYSPELITAQEELLQALKSAEEMKGSDIAVVRESSEMAIQASRDKLRLWGLTATQIQQIESSGRTFEHLSKYSPMAGIVIKKHLKEGAYVKEGVPVYSIADLSKLWIELEAYESDLPWLHFAQSVSFETQAYPGELFQGQISFIHPVLNPKTRTIKVRLNVDNRNGRLKPDMFVNASVRVQLGQSGQMVDSSLAGKWISPMHPEVISDEPGPCTVCGMDLVPAEELGFTQKGDSKIPLVIPASSVLITGKRAVVYVKTKKGIYQGRVITLGPRAGEDYIVKQGLSEGELVVTNGAFKIDSALQIMAKPSMMSQEDLAELKSIKLPQDILEQLYPIQEAYLSLSRDLSQDKFTQVKEYRIELTQAIETLQVSNLSPDVATLLTKRLHQIQLKMNHISNSESLKIARLRFEPLSKQMILLTKQFGSTQAIRIAFCSMALNDQGAQWLQLAHKIENPYFGSGMYRCGEIQQVIGEDDKSNSLNDDPQINSNSEKTEMKTGHEDHTEALPKKDSVSSKMTPADLVLQSYLSIQKALSKDSLPAGPDVEAIIDNLPKLGVPSSELKTLAHMHHKKLAAARADFAQLSKILIGLAEKNSFSSPVKQAYCSMAFDDQGASWLQTAERIENPYFGSGMYRCGSIKKNYTPKLKENVSSKSSEEKMEHKHHQVEEKQAAEQKPKSTTGAPETLQAYLNIQKSLSKDQLPSANDVETQIKTLRVLLPSEDKIDSLAHMHHKDLQAARADFQVLSEIMIQLAEKGHFKSTVRKAYCSMAFNDQGASWLQTAERVENPYWGSQMYRCGSIKKVYQENEK
ncbi:efflux RND transporter periplasmic adaptor subunit [Lentisphaera marina]|uniref:efflux RND transporter periplasmic adaptor subunit n=1 Tax=Lentisphaera marina TaxID=1111041 RepID=UPI002366B37B|nr:efflux RND transporter periplasmic adaptor subunit [Lentisphaera marina]MDD7984363.1 efflux RND transporter periplasmic adaptor subunit [Lentisphaera marina]